MKDKEKPVQRKKEYAGGIKRNELPKDHMFTLSFGGSETFESLRYRLSVDEKIHVTCIDGHGHCDGKGPENNKKVAFVSKDNKGAAFYWCGGGSSCGNQDALWCEE